MLFPVIAVAVQTLLRYYYYGDIFPNTYYLKVTGIPLFERLYRGMKTFLALLYFHSWPLFLLVLINVLSSFRLFDFKRALLIAIVCGQCLYSIYVGGDAWEWMRMSNRYICIAMPALFILFSFTVQEIAARLKSREMLFLSLIFPTALIFTGDSLFKLAGALFVFLITLILYIHDDKDFIPSMRNGHAYMKNIQNCMMNHSKYILVFFVFALVNIQLWDNWVLNNGASVGDDERMARLGLVIREHTTPDATVAVYWAGAIPYFSERQSYDLLGKSDKHIAKQDRNPMAKHFLPGHSKWDYAYTLSFHPDIIQANKAKSDLENFTDFGYSKIGRVWIKNDTTKVQKDAFRNRAGRSPALLPKHQVTLSE